MATLNELYNELWLDVSPNISDDSVLDERLLKAFIHKMRALFARNEMNKSHRSVDAVLIQDLGLVELETTDMLAEVGLSNIHYTVLKTVEEIPAPLELHNKQAFTFIGPFNQMNKGFKIVDYGAIPYAGHGRFNQQFMYAVYMNKHIYIIGNCNNPAFKGLKYIGVKGVFENPEDAERFYTPTGDPCYTDDSPYPLPLYMWAYCKKEILQTDLRQFYVALEDPLNNATNDLTRLTDNRRRNYRDRNNEETND